MVDIESAEGVPIVNEFLLKSLMYFSEKLLNFCFVLQMWTLILIIKGWLWIISSLFTLILEPIELEILFIHFVRLLDG